MTSTREQTPVDLEALKLLGAKEFGDQVDSLLLSVAHQYYDPSYHLRGPPPAVKVIGSRASEQPTVAALALILQSTLENKDSFYKASLSFWFILSDMPLYDLEIYRPILEDMAAKAGLPMTSTGQEYSAAWVSLRNGAKGLLRLMNDHTAVWTPKSKYDDMAIRSLRERVTSAEEMQPHVRGLLAWLADGNWPNWTSCAEQLARFPEATIGPICELIRTEREDIEWVYMVLAFVARYLPAGLYWAELRSSIEQLREDMKGNPSYDGEMDEDMRNIFDKHDAWLSEHQDRTTSDACAKQKKAIQKE
ncbi:hypothetical protein TWF730_002588 [Orbilia blumenaviensis]|uniref:DUF5071 domain-containing protein n=1 Tax=Orbilia blumenaviensis TaxID=1796055 RepID=A0AAV9UAC0_9PEZI